jgi:excisionase family DNA binding protein
MTTNTPIEPVGLSIDETCVFTGFGKTKIYQAINEGRLAAKKYGHRTIVLRQAAQDFLAALPARRDPTERAGGARD